MSRYLLVELAEDLAACRTTRAGVWASIMQVGGVYSLTDLEVISRATLDQWLLPQDQSLVGKPVRKRIRRAAA